jgi:(1->4)-alpha-D-glucan 1-alpha-D-glucosylmutase
MRALLERQHYVLDFWRTASRDINYRRFFDVNELIALKVEDAEVFDATHKTVLQFVADGLVDGLRIDHIDGLLEPRRYLERLRAAVDARRPPEDGARFRSSSRRSSRRARRCPPTGRWTAPRATSS